MHHRRVQSLLFKKYGLWQLNQVHSLCFSVFAFAFFFFFITLFFTFWLSHIHSCSFCFYTAFPNYILSKCLFMQTDDCFLCYVSAFLLYMGSVMVVVFVLIFHFAPRYGHSNVLIFTGICSLMGSLSVFFYTTDNLLVPGCPTPTPSQPFFFVRKMWFKC